MWAIQCLLQLLNSATVEEKQMAMAMFQYDLIHKSSLLYLFPGP